MTLNLPSSLVGIGSHVERVETLLCLESPQFCMVGLWGMGGIGKTTVAKTVYRRICSTFDGFYFVDKVSEKLRNQSVDDLREKIALKLFEEESLNMGSRTLHPDFIMKQLQRKKVLIVLDDVDNAIKLGCLKFLEFHHPEAKESKVRFCWERFKGFPDEVRFLRWDAYPQTSLPSNFCAENLVELHMPNSAIRKLWTGKQSIVNLKVINLEYADKLVEFPDVSEGRNIERINLSCCKSLVKLSPSVHHLPKLKSLNLLYGATVDSGPTTFDSKVLETLCLCRGFKTFPRLVSANVIRALYLDGTDIREVPSSVELLKGLEKLSMWRCKKLSIISTNICKLKSLLKLDLRYCTSLESFPEIMEPMESLTIIHLRGCTSLTRLPNDHSFRNLKSLKELHLDHTAITELPSSIQHIICLKHLGVSGCRNLTSLPSSIHHLRNLETINANGCVSLKTISSACFASESIIRILRFTNCFNWDEEERGRVLDIAFSNLLYMLGQGILSFDKAFEMMLPWSAEIPQWFCYSQSIGSSLTLKLTVDNLCSGLAFCVVFKPKYANFSNLGDSYYFNHIYCYVDDHACGLPVTSCKLDRLSKDIEHLLLWYNPWDKKTLRKYFGREVSLQFYDSKGELEITKCGVLIIPVECC